MKIIAAISVLMSIHISALAADSNIIGALGCGGSGDVEICRDTPTNTTVIHKKGKSIRITCEQSSSDQAFYSIRIVAGNGDVTISPNKTYMFTFTNGSTASTSPEQLRDALRDFCIIGLSEKLQNYATGSLYRDVESANEGKIAFFVSYR